MKERYTEHAAPSEPADTWLNACYKPGAPPERKEAKAVQGRETIH